MKKQVFSLLSIIIILLGCTPIRFDQTGQVDQKYTPIDKNNISELSEITTLSGGQDCGVIPTIQVVIDKDLVYGYCSKSSELIIWNVSSEIEEERYVLDIVGDLGFYISKDGNSLFGPNQRLDNFNSDPDKLISEVSIWDINDNLNPTCVDLCVPGDEEYYHSIRGTVISPGGNLVLVYYPFWYELFDLEKNEGYQIALSQDADFYVDIGNMAFHPSNKKLAVSFRETALPWYGDVEIIGLHGPIPFFTRVFKDKSSNTLQYIKALEFSPDGKWLANITDDGINIWRTNIFKTHKSLEINTANIIAFSGDSNLLFIGTNNEIIVYDLYGKELISTIETPNIISISISAGDEILAWGNGKGQIHIFGIH